MTTFAANMKSFTADVAAANVDRADALKSVRHQTKHVLADARTFVKDAARHHRSVAKQVRSTLTHERKARVKQVGQLKDQIHERLEFLQGEVQETLQQCATARRDHLDQLFEGFREVRTKLAADLQEAGRIWRDHNHRHKHSAKRSKQD